MRIRFLLVAVAAGLGTLTAPGADPAAGTLRQWVAQLGSDRYAEREAASQALDALGPKALDVLRQAAKGPDPEVARRAAALARRIEQRVETAQLLEPKTIRLVYREAPVREAVEDFARRSGFPIRLEGPAPRLADRKVTVDTGEVSFWEAFARFCAAAGLVEKELLPPAGSEPQPEYYTRRDIRFGPGRRLYEAPPRDPTLRLVPGDTPALPTHLAGAVRIRALPPAVPLTGFTRNSREVFFGLEVTPEPGMAWRGVVNLRVAKAQDDRGQALTQTATSAVENGDLALLLPNGAILLEDTGEAAAPSWRHVPVRLVPGAAPSARLAEVQGTLSAQVQGPFQPLLTLEGVAAGKSVAGPTGATLKVLDVKLSGNDLLEMRLVLQTGNPVGFAPGGGRMMRMPRGVVLLRDDEAAQVSAANLALYDAQGKAFRYVSFRHEYQAGAAGAFGELRLAFHAAEGRGAPARLVYSGRRTITIDMPFVLKDVALPK